MVANFNMNKKSLNSEVVKAARWQISTTPHQLPLFASSSFSFDNTDQGIDIFTGKQIGHVYSRYGNPTIDAVAQKIANLETYHMDEEGFGLLCSSGMAAISTLLYSLCEANDSVLTQANLYGGTTELFNKILVKHGIHPIFTNLKDIDGVEACLRSQPAIKVIYAETPTNPTLDCIDIRKLAALAKSYDKYLVVDNTFCTPIIQRPLELGADFVVHSTTKFLNGHGNSIAGVIVSHRYELKSQIWQCLKLMGSTCNVWDAWLLDNGMRTLALRMRQHSDNAMALASFLEQQSGKVKKVNYCGLSSHQDHTVAASQMSSYGGMLSFELDTDLRGTIRFIDALQFCTQAPTLGDVDTLVLHPATSSHLNVDPSIRADIGVTDSLVRVSVGIEDFEDIKNDIIQALDKV